MKEENDLALIALGKADLRDMKRLEQIGLLEIEAEENKPEWWQSPITITIIATVAFVAGLGLAL